MNAALAPPAPTPPPLRATGYRFTAPSRPDSIGILREVVGVVLRAARLMPLVDPARVCTSEVVTNVHVHTRAVLISVDVTIGHDHVTVNVYDDAPKMMPMPREARFDEPHGRGLHVVEDFTDAWGVSQFGGLLPVSKSVWFQFDLRRRGLVT